MRVLNICFFLAFLVACAETPELDVGASEAEKGSNNVEPENAQASTTKILATVQGEPVTQQRIDESIALSLFELDWAKYEARKAALADYVKTLQDQSDTPLDIHVQIEPPIPPRVTLPTSMDIPVIGEHDAPVLVSIFCNYQSSHCLSMQPVYSELAELYQGRIAFQYYELPLRFHRDSFGASLAATCAHQQSEFSAYHRALWGSRDQLTRDAYLVNARQLGLDEAAFEACFDSKSAQDAIYRSMQLAEDQGFRNVPVTLVNGLYLNGPKDVHTLRFMIDHEIERLGVKPTTVVASQQVELLETKLALRLEGVTLAQDPNNGAALIQALESDQTQSFRIGQEILPDVLLHSVFASYVLIENSGTIERLSMSGSPENRETYSGTQDGDYISDIEKAALASGNVLDTDELPPAGLEYQYRGVVAPDGERPLSRAWVDEQLHNQDALRTFFQPAELEVEGVRIMRLEGIAENEFYKTLGLQEKDVIMRVNGEWLHEQQNTLFSTLEETNELSLVVMRKGLPVHYAYRVN